MFNKKNKTYFFCKRELVQGLLELTSGQSRENQAMLLCASKVILQLMPVDHSIELEDKNV